MAKTAFVDKNPQAGTPGTTVPASFLNKIFSMVFDGKDQDGSAPIIVYPLKEVSGTYPMDKDLDSDILADASGGAFDVTLPALADVPMGRVVTVEKDDTSANAVTVKCAGTDKIDGVFAEVDLTLPGDKAMLKKVSATKWKEIGFQSGEIGKPRPSAGSVVGYGDVLCDGAEKSRTTYARLFAIIGIAYGVGDGATTFNMPKINGRGIIGLDNMGGVPADVVTDANADILGGTLGAEDHVLSENETPPHAHKVQYTRNGSDTGSAQQLVQQIDSYTNGNPSSKNSETVGGGEAHNNMQPSIVMNFVMKY